tara:strand:- start:297 stop:989 length:693 start_codon:yes stop_codon:yes gene_type:complete
MQNLCVIIPFYNEKKFLEESLKRVLDNDIYDQIILSDDCSNDGSELIAKDFSDNYEKILYIKSNKNQGKGNALNQAKSLINTSHVVVHDADLEYFPGDIVEMFNCSKEYPESLILGSRFIGSKERKNVYFRTFVANKVMSLFFSLINFYNVTDVATCYKLMPASFFKNINLVEKGFSIEIELLSKYLKINRNIVEVPIMYEGRSYSEGKKIKTSDGFKYLFNTLKYRIFD